MYENLRRKQIRKFFNDFNSKYEKLYLYSKMSNNYIYKISLNESLVDENLNEMLKFSIC